VAVTVRKKRFPFFKMQPTKPPYDPNIHLSEAKRKEFEDEELARRLHREMLAEDQAERERIQRMQEEANQRDMDDMELARRLQFEYEDSDNPMQRHLEDRQRETGISDQLEYARSLQQQALRDVNQAPASHDGESGSNELDDEEMARRMNELYEMGLDSISDFDAFQDVTGCNHQSSGATTASANSSQFRTQEQEDAAIARMMAERGESLRFIDLNNLTSCGAVNRSTPGAHHVPIPAGYSEAMVQASSNSRQVTATLVEDKPDDTPPGHRGDDSSTVRASQPQPTRRSSTQPENRLQSLPENDVGVDPPGAHLPPNVADMDSVGSDNVNSKPKSKGRSGIFGLGKALNLSSERAESWARSSKPRKIPIPMCQPPKRNPGPVPYSVSGSTRVDVPIAASPVPKKKSSSSRSSRQAICCACNQPAMYYLSALDRRYHHDCFRCTGCHDLIDTTGPFAYMEDEAGEKHPLHKECFSELYGVKCTVCKKAIPAGPDGKVSFVKHPFFDTEQMCPSHASSPGRRCTGCHRFEPQDEPFADLGDVGRVVCYSCCRTAIVDSSDAEPLWKSVINFFDKKLNLSVWADMREVPVLIVGYKSLNEQMKQTGGVHGGSTQIMTRGVCLTEHQTSGRKLKATSLRFDNRKQSFEKRGEHEKGFTFLQVPDANKVNPDSSVTCILCLSGLPKDLTASVLAHEAAHAWIKLHPRYDVMHPIDPQVEEGCAQLIAMLFLSEGLPPASTDTDGDGGPSEAKLRQYFKFSIESDSNEIYGEGYRKAAAAYSAIGIEALMSHVVLYGEFPNV